MSWTMHRQNPKRTGLGIALGSIIFGSDDTYLYNLNPDGTLKWSCNIYDKSGYGSPVESPNTDIIIGDEVGFVSCVSKDGVLKWRYQTGSYIRGGAYIDKNGIIYITSRDKYLHVLNPDGTLKWKFLAGGYIESSPVIDKNGVIYFGCYDYYLYAINPDGTLKWKFATGGQIEKTSPSIGDDGTIYIGSRDRYIYAINPDGSLKWKYYTGYYTQLSCPAIDKNGVIYINDNYLYVYAMNPDGTLKWKYAVSNYLYNSPAIDPDGNIIVVDYYGWVYKLSPDGSLIWKIQTRPSVYSSPSIDPNGNIYVTTTTYYCYCISKDGDILWIYSTYGNIFSSPAIIGALGKTYTVEVKDYLGLKELTKQYRGLVREVKDFLGFRDINKEGYSLTGKEIFRVYYLPMEYKAIWDLISSQAHNTKIDACKSFTDLLVRVVNKLGVEPENWTTKKDTLDWITQQMTYVAKDIIFSQDYQNLFVNYVCGEWTNALSLTKEIYDLFKQKTGKTIPYVEELISMAEENSKNLVKRKLGDIIEIKDHNLIIDTLKYLEVALTIIEANYVS